jgi:hypothetical protein
MPSYCSNCGQEIPDKAKKCPKCKAEFVDEIVTGSPEPQVENAKISDVQVEPVESQSKIQKKSLFEKLWFLVLSSSVFVGVGLFCLIRGLGSLIDYLQGPDEFLAIFDVYYGVPLTIYGIFCTIFGVSFAIPGRMGKESLLGGMFLMGLPLICLIYLYGLLDYAGSPDFPINTIVLWAAFMIYGLIVLIARLKSIKH